MHEFFWFILGALSYKILESLIDTGRKAKFILKIKFLAFQLIGRAFEELVFVRTLRGDMADEAAADTEKIKALHNENEAFIHAWKKHAVHTLNASVPFYYKNMIEIKDWDQLMSLLDTYYKDKFKNGKDTNI
jgi:hypothetical protein